MSELQNNKEQKVGQSFKNFWGDLRDFFFDLIDLSEGSDRKGTIQNIKNNKRMRGANAWLLMCSIMIASLGLDLDSPAVIIGAMLISPLMSPILGVGLGVGINDRETLYISLQHFGVAIGIALITSTIYFFFTPFGEATSEIRARISPNTLDALVAFFGGIAGVISGSRIDKSNAIPGVAIATALMPPLCVTGFGIANWNMSIIINSFYLFFLNATLVAFATFLIVRMLRFPMKEYETLKEKRNMMLIVYGTSLLIVLPSMFILFQVWQDFKLKQNTQAFIEEYCGENYKYVDSWERIEGDSIDKIAIKVYGTSNKYFDKGKMEARLKDYNIENTVIDLIPTTEVDLAKLQKLEAELSGFKTIAGQLEVARELKNADELMIELLQAKIDSIHADTLPFFNISNEIKAAFPDIEKVAFASAKETDFKKVNQVPILLIDWQKGTPLSTIRREEPRIEEFIKVRANLKTLKILKY